MQQLPVDQWISRDTILSTNLEDNCKTWLCHLDSMTQMIKHHATASFELIVLSESVTTATPSEQQFLGLSDSQAYIREIVMKADNQDWLFARSVFPQSIMTDSDQRLMNLGTTPLGSLFFDSEGKRQEEHNPRQTIDAGILSNSHELIAHTSFPVVAELNLYARRSLFNYQGLPALVQEVFLPAHPIYQ